MRLIYFTSLDRIYAFHEQLLSKIILKGDKHFLLEHKDIKAFFSEQRSGKYLYRNTSAIIIKNSFIIFPDVYLRAFENFRTPSYHNFVQQRPEISNNSGTTNISYHFLTLFGFEPLLILCKGKSGIPNRNRAIFCTFDLR
jgi:hypothetical protein